MFNTEIQTTVGVRGFVVFIEYFVTESYAIEWWLNRGSYDPGHDHAEVSAGLDLLETLLRMHEHGRIESELLNEFESRQYAQEQAQAALLAQEDIPF